MPRMTGLELAGKIAHRRHRGADPAHHLRDLAIDHRTGGATARQRVLQKPPSKTPCSCFVATCAYSVPSDPVRILVRIIPLPLVVERRKLFRLAILQGAICVFPHIINRTSPASERGPFAQMSRGAIRSCSRSRGGLARASPQLLSDLCVGYWVRPTARASRRGLPQGRRVGMVVADRRGQIAAFVQVDAQDGAGDRDVEAIVMHQAVAHRVTGTRVACDSTGTHSVLICITPRSSVPLVLRRRCRRGRSPPHGWPAAPAAADDRRRIRRPCTPARDRSHQ